MTLDARIGLEIHAYVRSAAKLFCPCPADALRAPGPNANVCETCTGQPGAKPMAPNRAALEAGVRVARALGSGVRNSTRFLRKHYFYPDLPSNYQRTSEPFAEGGALRGVRIREIHWEEDPGAYDLDRGAVDYNRSGCPLLEIVTEPDMRSADEVRAFLLELAVVLRYLGVWREAAGVKADVNVSLEGGNRVEIKNVSGFRNAERAAEVEIARQADAAAAGRPVARETRGFDEATGASVRLRAKEEAVDYRFVPDPDLPRLAGFAALAEAEEGPLERRARLARIAGVDDARATPLVEERRLADAFEAAAERAGSRLAYEFLVRDVRAELATRSTTLEEAGIGASEIADLVAALGAGRITAHAATRALRDGLDRGALASALATEVGAGLSAGDEVRAAADAAVAENPKAVADWRGGKTGALNFVVGAAMKKLRGRGRPDDVRRAVEEAIARSAGAP